MGNRINTTASTESNFFVSGLTILFIALKLTGYISWSWWWVLSPLWISILLALVVGTLAILISSTKDK
ncbi:MAG TPA: hypothetical protein ENI14_02335 [Thermoplasmatales archaeon]|nr:hypothetical protein [Thermoplasmatales archaeon]